MAVYVNREAEGRQKSSEGNRAMWDSKQRLPLIAVAAGRGNLGKFSSL
jgi:hypothetical protein